MTNLWRTSDARSAVQRWSDPHGEAFALRLYSARLLGADADLVLHGGGNVSFKGQCTTILGDTVDTLFIKGSGHDLAALEPAGLPAVQLEAMRKLRVLQELSDEEMVNEIRTHLLRADSPLPSIETLLHAFLPHRYVDHTHADAVVALTNRPNGVEIIQEALGDRMAIVPYVRPGFELAMAVADAYERTPQVDGIVLLKHGLITFGEDAEQSYATHIELVTRCEEFLTQKTGSFQLTPRYSVSESPERLAVIAAPILRGLVAMPTQDEDQPYRRSIVEWRASDVILDAIHSAEASRIVDGGPLTGDHLIRTKHDPLLVADPRWSDASALRTQLAGAVEDYQVKYKQYITDHGGSPDGVDLSPRVVFLPGAGMFCFGDSSAGARLIADLAEHALITKAKSLALGPYEFISPDHAFDLEFRQLQRRKLSTSDRRPLAGQVVAISGAAGAIGTAIAHECADAGAHVAVTDIDAARVTALVDSINEKHRSQCAFGVVMDVTNEQSVQDGYEQIVRRYGGVDVIVPNAGIAHVAPIDEIALADFQRVMNINVTGYLLFMREGVRILKRQAIGGNVVIISSKNVFAPGKDFAAYSASKAAGHQIGKVAAIELAPHKIRVNMINADAVFGDKTTPSGLWETVGPDRAKSRGLSMEQLPEFYKERNLLKTRVYGKHVGRAVVFFASNATPTTGATLPVDGGVVEAFPR